MLAPRRPQFVTIRCRFFRLPKELRRRFPPEQDGCYLIPVYAYVGVEPTRTTHYLAIDHLGTQAMLVYQHNLATEMIVSSVQEGPRPLRRDKLNLLLRSLTQCRLKVSVNSFGESYILADTSGVPS